MITNFDMSVVWIAIVTIEMRVGKHPISIGLSLLLWLVFTVKAIGDWMQ